MFHTLLPFLWSVAAAYGAALAVWPLLRSRGQWNVVGAALAVAAIAACPLLIPRQQVIARALACLWCVDVLFRVADYARQLRRETAPNAWRVYCSFLIPFPFLLVVFGQKQLAATNDKRWSIQLVRLATSAAAIAAALLVLMECTRITALRESFLLDHIVKLVIFVVAIEAISQAMAALERLAGFDTAPIVDRAYLARTPAEFWLRFNQRVRLWLYVNAFVPAGGRRAPLRGIAVVFLVSAVFHEFFFALATSRLDGYQFAFFMLQAPAVMLSPPLARLANQTVAGQIVARSFTVLWFAATSPLFFHGVDRVFPFCYASGSWLP